jgi:hypothetical protein
MKNNITVIELPLGSTLKVGDIIPRRKRRNDVVVKIDRNSTFIMGANACFSVNLPMRPSAGIAYIRPQTWWEEFLTDLREIRNDWKAVWA